MDLPTTPSLVQAPVVHGCRLNVSTLLRFQRALPVHGFAIKYVLEGLERYTVDGVPHPVRTGRYLLVNGTCRTQACVDSDRPVVGLCIDLGAPLLAEVVQGRLRPEEPFAVESDAGAFTGAGYPEAVHSARFTTLGPVLHRVATTLRADPAAAARTEGELYFLLAERLVHDHRALWPRLGSLTAVRSGTRKDLYRRVQRAKALMDTDPAAALPVAALAREAAMGEYHFFRAFRAVEGLTPHQYRLQRRLELGHTLLAQGHHAVGTVALLTGFADGAAFSKAFRKRYGRAPVDVLRATRRF